MDDQMEAMHRTKAAEGASQVKRHSGSFQPWPLSTCLSSVL